MVTILQGLDITLQAFIVSFTTIFIMEMGDKTQLAAFALSIKYRSPLKVFIGVTLGLTGVTIITVLIGFILKEYIDIEILAPLIGILFVIVGLAIVLQRNKEEKENICSVSLEKCTKNHENCPEIHFCDIYLKEVTQKNAIIGSLIFMFLAELGDKTMIMGAGLTTQFVPLGVFFGALTALILVNAIGVIVGEKIANKIPTGKIKLINGLLFIILGLAILII